MEATKRDYGPIMAQFVLPGKPSGAVVWGAGVNSVWHLLLHHPQPLLPLTAHVSACLHLYCLYCCSQRPGCAVHEDLEGGEELRPLPLVPCGGNGKQLPGAPPLRARLCTPPLSAHGCTCPPSRARLRRHRRVNGSGGGGGVAVKARLQQQERLPDTGQQLWSARTLHPCRLASPPARLPPLRTLHHL